MSKIHSYAAQVDGDEVAHSEDPGRTVVLAPGKRFVTLGCTMGAAATTSSIPVDIKPGGSYKAKCELTPDGTTTPFIYVWLEESAGTPVTERKLARFQLRGGLPILIPLPH